MCQGCEIMIYFPEKAKYEYRKGSKTTEKCKILLEKSLRKLGKFEKNEPIYITKYQYGKTLIDIIYEVKDLNNTVFTFYNFNAEFIDDNNRYCKNYEITLKKENSNFYYKYDFFEYKQKESHKNLRLIEVSFQLTENRIIRLERKYNEFIRIIIEEDSKKYLIGFYDHSEEHDIVLLSDFENMVKKAVQIEKMNLENILKIINNQSKVSFIYIFKENKILANIELNNGNIINYKIEDENKKIEVKISDRIIRNTERKYNDKIIKNSTEITEENYEKINSDYKMLFKHL